MDVDRTDDLLPSEFTCPILQGDFLTWTVRDLTRSWGEGGRAWFNVYVGFHMLSQEANGLCATQDLLPHAWHRGIEPKMAR